MSAQYLVPSVYATINAAKDAIPADLSGEGLQEIIIDTGTYPETLIVSGFSNPSVDDRIIIRPADGDEHNGIFGAGVILNGVSSRTMRIETGFTDVLDIEAHAGSNGQEPWLTLSVGPKRIERCLADGKGFTGLTGFLMSATGGSVVVNCLSRDTVTGFLTDQGTQKFYGCLANDQSRGFDHTGGTMICHNSGAMNSLISDFNGTISGSENFSEDGTAPGTDALINQNIASMNFIDLPNDFHITIGSILQDSGGDQVIIYTEDIDRTPIPAGNYPRGYHYLELIPPLFENDTPTVFNIKAISADCNVQINEDGNVYGVVIPRGENAPSSAQVKAGQDSTGSPVAAGFSANAAATASTNVVLNFTNLISETEYELHVVAEDVLDNLQPLPTFVLLESLSTVGEVGLLDDLPNRDARAFTPTDDVEIVMPNPPPKAGTYPKEFICNITGTLMVKTLGNDFVPIPVIAGQLVRLTVKEFRATGTTGVTSVTAFL